MNRVLQTLIVSIVALLGSMVIYLYISDFLALTQYGLLYTTLLVLFNFLPLFWVFFLLCDFIIVKLVKKNKKYNNIILQIAIALILMVVVVGILVVYDFYIYPEKIKEKGMAYLVEYLLFFLFTPLSIIVNYLLFKKEAKNISTREI